MLQEGTGKSERENAGLYHITSVSSPPENLPAHTGVPGCCVQRVGLRIQGDGLHSRAVLRAMACTFAGSCFELRAPSLGVCATSSSPCCTTQALHHASAIQAARTSGPSVLLSTTETFRSLRFAGLLFGYMRTLRVLLGEGQNTPLFHQWRESTSARGFVDAVWKTWLLLTAFLSGWRDKQLSYAICSSICNVV